MEIYGHLGKEGIDFINQVAASIVRATDESSLARKGICKERFCQVVSVTTQVPILRRVHRYNLALKDR